MITSVPNKSASYAKSATVRTTTVCWVLSHFSGEETAGLTGNLISINNPCVPPDIIRPSANETWMGNIALERASALTSPLRKAKGIFAPVSTKTDTFCNPLEVFICAFNINSLTEDLQSHLRGKISFCHVLQNFLGEHVNFRISEWGRSANGSAPTVLVTFLK